jgi:hypothetical protein
VRIHVGDETMLVALVPADVLVGVNEARGGGHGAAAWRPARAAQKEKRRRSSGLNNRKVTEFPAGAGST